jgi:hypothetical protein
VQPIVDDARRGWKWITLGGNAHVNGRAFDQAGRQPGLPIEVQTFEAHIASGYRREPAHARGAIETDAFIT